MTFKVQGYEHVGIRVTDRDVSRRFYEKLGWHEEIDLPQFTANEMVNSSGVYINLIFNGVKRVGNKNILQDEPLRYPGVTHAAFIVEDLDDLMAMLAREDIGITDGPVIYSDRRRVIFIRDPDGNVLEFNELFKKH
jgi:catechol 2,3-dioxygenase-like lactoylglutathione lyase family enzyme